MCILHAVMVNFHFRSSIIYLFFLASVVACDEPPELPLAPSISFNSITFKEGVSGRDSLILMVDFEDGDGDLGLDRDESDVRFQEFFFVTTTGELIPSYDDRVVRFGAPNQPPLDFEHWIRDTDFDGDEEVDTVRVEFNENFFNIFVDFFYRADTNGDGDIDDDEDYIKIDFNEIFGGQGAFGLNGRFFPLNTSDNERPLRGTLTYKMVNSFRVSPIFRDNILKIDVQIQDRALNRSNIVATNDFMLQL